MISSLPASVPTNLSGAVLSALSFTLGDHNTRGLRMSLGHYQVETSGNIAEHTRTYFCFH
jgi:hypothetical protein